MPSEKNISRDPLNVSLRKEVGNTKTTEIKENESNAGSGKATNNPGALKSS